MSNLIAMSTLIAVAHPDVATAERVGAAKLVDLRKQKLIEGEDAVAVLSEAVAAVRAGAAHAS